ncbi:MAG: flagellar M-ring protein FliF [Alphaproteobacteria bacterium]|nr:flagellar M-ring protein FliF [Alphaproteobacteria bacterium]
MNNLLQTLKNMSLGRLGAIAAIIIFLISFFVYLTVQMNTKEYGVLYTDLELEDAKQIVARLDSENVDYKLSRNGTEILVPLEDVNRMRVNTAELAMASKGSHVGYEVFDNTDALGSTNFVQNVNLIRALEGELARTIRSVDNIKSARVHLVMPKREMFSREEQKPSASVVIKTINGNLDLSAVQSIQRLVSAAVPKLDIRDISIVDTSGNLLTNYDDEEKKQNQKNTTNELMRLEQERKLAAKVQDMLEKTIGEGRAQAEVTIEMDFDEVITNEELYDPDGQVVRSIANVSEQGVTGEKSQPVTVAQNIPNSESVTTDSGTFEQNSRVEETINYEISKIIRNKVKNTGTIKRLTVAAVVDGVYEKNSEGKMAYRPRTEAEMESLRALVKSAVGYDPNRGDMVEVENLRFAGYTPEEEEVEEILYMGLTKSELLRIAEGLGVAIVAILVILLVIRPLINNAFEPTSGVADKLLGGGSEEDNLLLSNFLNDDDGTDELINLNKVDGRVKVSSLKKLNNLVEKNPEAAVNVLRSWLYNNDN